MCVCVKAVQEIQQLVTLESKLKKKKRRLMKKRDRLFDAVVPSGEIETSCHVTPLAFPPLIPTDQINTH